MAIGQPDDPLEQEADRIADQLMKMPDPQKRSERKSDDETLQRKCEKCEDDEKQLQKKESLSQSNVHSSIPDVPPIVDEVLHSSGQPLDRKTRAFMEPRFGHDFTNVRIHTDARAAESAREVNALAYTVGRDVVFGSRQYRPSSHQGMELMAHELAHVVQQGGDGMMLHRKMVPPGDCTWVEHTTLQDDVNDKCKVGTRACNVNDDCPTILSKIDQNAKCIAARQKINNKCYKGGDTGHAIALAQAVAALSNCWAVYSRKCQAQQPYRPPVTVPVTRPVTVPSSPPWWVYALGITGAAVLALADGPLPVGDAAAAALLVSLGIISND